MYKVSEPCRGCLGLLLELLSSKEILVLLLLPVLEFGFRLVDELPPALGCSFFLSCWVSCFSLLFFLFVCWMYLVLASLACFDLLSLLFSLFSLKLNLWPIFDRFSREKQVFISYNLRVCPTVQCVA